MTIAGTSSQQKLLDSIKRSLDALEKLLEDAHGEWQYDDPVYRFYHHSFKVYSVQQSTERIVAALQALRPEEPLNDEFLQLVREGTGKKFSPRVNREWASSTRPLLEAFFHSRFFLEMVVKHGRELHEAPAVLPSGWAAVLYLYRLR